jgi:hypothetical protein
MYFVRRVKSENKMLDENFARNLSSFIITSTNARALQRKNKLEIHFEYTRILLYRHE